MKPFLVAGVFILAVGVTVSHGADTSRIKITTKRKDDRVEVKAEQAKATISVHSPFGISHATIERLDQS